MLKFYAKSDGKTLKEHNLDLLKKLEDLKSFFDKNQFDVLKDEDFEILKLAVFIHDLGKINYVFQKRMVRTVGKDDPIKLLESMENVDKIKEIKLRHEILSVVWGAILFKEILNEEELSLILTLVLLHHYNEYYLRIDSNLYFLDLVNDYEEEIRNYFDFIMKNKDTFNEYLGKFKESLKIKYDIKIENINFDNLLEVKISYTKDIKKLVLLLGILRRCDYSGSGDFDIEKPTSYRDILNKANICQNDWWQKRVLDQIEKNKNILLIAPTGSGKTEFSLLLLKYLNRKLLYSLPLRVALNDLYKNRFPKYFDENYINVLHSTNYLEYINKSLNIEDTYKMLDESRMLSFPINLTTPDQTLLISLKYYGYDKIVSLIPYSFIVVDEIQMYNEEMLAILVASLKMIKDFGGKILVMSATVPKFVKEVLKQNKIIDKIIDVSENRYRNVECKYNFYSFYFSKFFNNLYKIKNLETKRHKLKLIDDYIIRLNDKKKKSNKRNKKEYQEDSKISKEVLKKLKEFENSNILIILNNVKKAIELYKELKKEISDDTIKLYLLHSRLLEKEKSKRVKEIKENKNTRKIVISTQLVEASVDIDFDILITEISTIDSQIQRWGRIWRNRGDYNKEDPNIFIFTGIDSKTTRIYSKKVVEKTIDVLKNYLKEYKGKILTYIDEKKMVDEVFSDPEIKEKYENKIKENLEYLEYFTAEKKSEAQRIFRKMASVPIVIKNFLNDNIKNIICKENSNKPWKEITNLNPLIIKKELVENSINVPIYMFEKIYNSYIDVIEFKGFYVIEFKDYNLAERTKNYGLDEVLEELNIKIDDDII